MLSLSFRTLVIHLFLLFFIRFTGKRQIGQLQLSEFVTTLLISEIACVPLSDPDVPLLYGILPVLLIVFLEVILSFIVTKCPSLKRLIDGVPSFLIVKGQLNQRELQRQRLGLEELLSALRLKDFSSIADVDYAILEQNGQLSAFPTDHSQSPPLAHPLVLDGRIDRFQLSLSTFDETSLIRHLRKLGCELSDVFLFSRSDDGTETLIRRTLGKKEG